MKELEGKMFEVGRLCVKIAGRDAAKKCVVVEVLKDNYVMIDGETRRRKCNIIHLEPLDQVLKIKEKAPHADVMKAFKDLGIELKETKKKESKPRPRKTRKKKEQKAEEPKKKEKPKAEKKVEEKPKAETSETKVSERTEKFAKQISGVPETQSVSKDAQKAKLSDKKEVPKEVKK